MLKRQASQIRCNKTGFILTLDDKCFVSVAWNDVETVVGYKRDCYTVDLICLGFVTRNGTVEVNENMRGWPELVEGLPALLPGLPPMEQWREQVAKPPFAPSVTKLYDRTASANVR